MYQWCYNDPIYYMFQVQALKAWTWNNFRLRGPWDWPLNFHKYICIARFITKENSSSRDRNLDLDKGLTICISMLYTRIICNEVILQNHVITTNCIIVSCVQRMSNWVIKPFWVICIIWGPALLICVTHSLSSSLWSISIYSALQHQACSTCS